jgi:putative addiction module component (TIGR02574 family)
MPVLSVAEQLETAALQLPAPDRARLAERLIASLDEDEDIEQAWSEEIERRLEGFRAGELTPVPAEEVFAKARAQIR